jgi:cell division protease FtsH
MDGLHGREENIIVIGATNAPEETLDPALLRPGRFDRKLYIGRPGLDEREKCFEYYLKKVKHEADIDARRLARKTVGKSPAEIESVVKEAALIATRNKKEAISYHEISDAIERIELGIKHRIKMTDHEREVTAFHEAGHLVVTYLIHPRSDVFKASIIPRRTSLGVVHPTPREEWFTMDRETLLADIKVSLAGYVGEKLKFATSSNGVASDFQKAMAIAHDMVWRFGMSGDNGFVGDFTVLPESQMSEELKEGLNQQTQAIVQKCLKETEALLTKEREIFERFARELLAREELEYDDIEAIFNEYGRANPRLFVKATNASQTNHADGGSAADKRA